MLVLVRALTDCFDTYFDQAAHHDTVLWFDAEGEYAAIRLRFNDPMGTLAEFCGIIQTR